MKKLFLILSVAILLCGAGNASAYLFDFNMAFTADNEITELMVVIGGTTHDQSDLKVDNWEDWTVADSNLPVTITTDSPFSIIWKVKNYGDPSSNNPGGFLADLTLSGGSDVPPEFTNGSLLSSSAWQVSLDNSTWKDATEYGSNGDVSTIWQTNNGGSVAGISDDAQWIWWEDNFGDAGAPDFVYIKVDISEPVPEPGTIILLGAGLLGLVTYRRKIKK